jgi:hypothetical protein
MIEATERSISRQRINSAIASAIMPFSAKIGVASPRLVGSQKYSDECPLTNMTIVNITSKISSQRSRRLEILNGARA